MKRFGLLVALALVCGGAHAANIALFADTTYVDYNVGNSSSEASNMQAALEAGGNTVTPFVGVDASSWNAALAGKQVLVIPEQENGTIAPALAAGAVTAVQNFVSGGGTLIVADDYSSTTFLNAVFGFSIVRDGSGSSSHLNAAAAAGTPFAGGPSTLPDNDATDGGAVTSSLPAGAKCLYVATSPSTECMVYLIPHGAGNIVYFAWDFFDAAPVGSQNGGWESDLSVAATGSAFPAALDVPTLGVYELAALALALAAIGTLLSRRRAARS